MFEGGVWVQACWLGCCLLEEMNRWVAVVRWLEWVVEMGSDQGFGLWAGWKLEDLDRCQVVWRYRCRRRCCY